MSEYEVYWLMDFPLTKLYVPKKNSNLSCEMECTSYLKSKQIGIWKNYQFYN